MSDLHQQLIESHERLAAGMDIPWLLDQWRTKTPNKDFMIWAPHDGEHRHYSYDEVYQKSLGLAAALSKRGVKPQDFVIIHLDNSPEFVFSWFACALLGAVAVSTNTRSVGRDMSYFSEHTSAVAVITQPEFLTMIQASCGGVKFISCTDNDAGIAADITLPDKIVPFAELENETSSEAELTALRREVDVMSHLSVQFTSGTTSRPKAVLWTHANGIWAGRVSAQHMRLRQDDRTLIYMPLFHTNAQGYSMLATLWVGATFVLQPKFSASRFWDLSMRYKLTWLSTIPFAFKAIAGQPVPEHHYRFWGTGAHIPALKQAFGVDVIGWWGMTETLTHGIVTDPDHPGPHGTIGRQAPEYDIQLRRGDGSLADLGERGHLFIRGVRGISLFKEYYRNDAANAEAFDKHGWFDTGDLIQSDAEGYLYFSDRDKDMLKIGAENVAASEIETVVMQTGLVSECAVVAQKHAMLDQVPVAFVIPARSEDLADGRAEQLAEKILNHCRENLADFKVPVSVRPMASFPRSTLEKVAKNELRALLDT